MTFSHMSFSTELKMNFLGVSTAGGNLSSSTFPRNDICKCQWHNAILSRAIVSELLHESEADCVWDTSPRDITSNSRRDYNSITHFAPRASSSETFLLASRSFMSPLHLFVAVSSREWWLSLTDVLSEGREQTKFKYIKLLGQRCKSIWLY